MAKVVQNYEQAGYQVAQQTGQAAITSLDYNQFVDLGRTAIYGTDRDKEAYYSALFDKIVDYWRVRKREKIAGLPDYYRNEYEWKGILAKHRIGETDASVNNEWNVGKQDYDGTLKVNVNKASIKSKYYSDIFTERFSKTIPPKIMRTAMDSAEGFNYFLDAYGLAFTNSLDRYKDAVALAARQALIAKAIKEGRVINILEEFNRDRGLEGNDRITKASEARFNAEVSKFFVQKLIMTKEKFKNESVVLNSDGNLNQTTEDYLRLDILSQYESDVQTYMTSDVYHNEIVTLPGHTSVLYWEGVGQELSDNFETMSTIKGQYRDDNDVLQTVDESGIVAAMYDKEAIACTLEEIDGGALTHPFDKITEICYNMTIRILVDTGENNVVFVLKDIVDDNQDNNA